MKKSIAMLSLVGLCVAMTAYADFSVSDWKYKKLIMSLPADGASKYVRVPLDREVSLGARTDLSDLRIVTSAGEEVPYQLVIENEAVHTESIPGQMQDLRIHGANVVFGFDLGASGAIHDHLAIRTTSKNFKRQVSVYASDKKLPLDDEGWNLLTNKGYIYNFYDKTSGFDAGSGEVSYPPSTARYLRVVIESGEGDIVDVTDARVLRILQRDAKKSEMQVPASIAQNDKEKSTEITADLGGSGLPTRKVTLSYESDKSVDFSRRVVVLGSNDATSWSMLGKGYVFSLNTPLFAGTDLSVSYPETEMRYIRVVIFNEDNYPISWTGTVILEGVARSIVYAPKFGVDDILYYGNDRASAPHYDIARYFQYFEGTALTESTLGVQEMNTSYVPPRAPEIPFTERNKNLMNAVLVVLVAVVAFLLVAYLKKLNLGKPRK